MTSGTALVAALGVMLAVVGCRDRRAAADAGVVDVSVDDAAAVLSDERTPLRGAGFPDGVIALTWDDGPDAHTLELARYLHDEHVPATFFVVGSWVPGISEELGVGATKLESGYERIKVLDELAALGHRIGAHTRHHRLLGHATADIARDELLSAPFRPDQVRFFRPPAGWWTAESSASTQDPLFASLVGPVHWDIDAKDWESSLYCRSEAKAKECEPGPIAGGQRVRAEVIAQRYLAQIEAARHGIVLLHDRVGDVGSRYALDLARVLVPALKERHYVFAPPVLAFEAPRPRQNAPATEQHRADINGDGYEDECKATTRGIECALSDGTRLRAASLWSPERGIFTLGDVNGDGRADLCFGTRCGLAP